MRIAIIDANPLRTAILEDGLREAGFSDLHCLSDHHRLLRRIAAIDPDVIIIDLENPNRDVLEEMFQVSKAVGRPVAMFVDQSDEQHTHAAIEAGVTTYIVDGLRKERIKPILDITISRFNAFERLRAELDEARTALADRKLIDKAKAVIMRQKGLDEAAAYRLMRESAMRQRLRLADVAQGVLTAVELLGDNGGEA